MGFYMCISDLSFMLQKEDLGYTCSFLYPILTTSPGRTSSAFWEWPLPHASLGSCCIFYPPSLGQGNWSMGDINPSWVSHTLTFVCRLGHHRTQTRFSPRFFLHVNGEIKLWRDQCLYFLSRGSLSATLEKNNMNTQRKAGAEFGQPPFLCDIPCVLF